MENAIKLTAEELYYLGGQMQAKYIDYDYDLRVFPDGAYKILDKSEYEYHKKIMHYSNDLDKIIKYELNNLITKYKNKEEPFDKETVKKYYDLYKKIQKNE